MEISKDLARQIIIESQGFNKTESLLEVINRLGYVQIDTLSVAERAHHHVLHSRYAEYSKADLDNLMSDRKIFEYWSHAAAYLPIEDFRFSLIKKDSFIKGASHWFTQNKKMNQYVLDRITSEGALQSKDFKHTRDTASEWYDWKPAKVALEQLFMEGKLMVAKRVNFQKVYDLTEKVLPTSIDCIKPTMVQYCEYLIKSTLRTQGVATVHEIGYLRKGIKSILSDTINALVEKGEIKEVRVTGLDQQYYILSKNNEPKKPTLLHILSPFDNLVIQRKRLENLFNFQYQIECYVPEANRKYGYYVLPILFEDRFVVRLDPKADRKTGIFTVKNIWFEPDYLPDDKFYIALAEKLITFSLFCGCQQIKIEKCSPAKYKRSLSAVLKQTLK